MSLGSFITQIAIEAYYDNFKQLIRTLFLAFRTLLVAFRTLLVAYVCHT